MDNELLLLSKNDIPFVEAQISIHQPTISEISLIGEESFFSGCQFLNFSKTLLSSEDRKDLENMSDFEIFMSIMCSSEKIPHKNDVIILLALLFPKHQIKFVKEMILLIGEDGVIARIDNTNFDIFKKIIISMFELGELGANGSGYNPVGKKANKIAEKLQKAKNRKSQDGIGKVAILSRYVSILAVGEQKSINDFMDYTVFQLKDEFKRFQMKQSFDMYIQAKMAGAKDLDEVDNWMDNIHP